MKLRTVALAFAMLVCLAGTAIAAHPLAISETRVDFGNMTEGPVVEKTVTLANTGKEAVTIENVTTS